MTKYEVVKADGTGATISIYASNPATFDWIISNVRTYEPQLKTKDEHLDIQEKIIRAQLVDYKRKGLTIFGYIITLLCENGFEPFGSSYRHYDFRKEVIE